MTPDDTHRKLPDEAPVAEHWVRAVIDSTPDGIIAIDEAGSIRLFNAAAEAIFGYREAEVLGRNVKLLIPPPYREQHDGYIERYQRTHEPHILGAGREVDGQRQDGTIFPLWIRVEQVAGARPLAYIATVRDITESRRLHEALAQSEQRYRDLFDNAPVAFFALSVDGRIQMVNHHAAELLRCSKEDLIGRDAIELYADTPTGKDAARAVRKRFQAGQGLIVEELEMRAADGRSVWVSLTDLAVRDHQGHTVESLSIVTDITERKRIEGELRKARDEMQARVEARTAERVSTRTADSAPADERLRRLAAFPDENPNPVIEAEVGGRVTYLNPVARALFPDLSMGGLQHPMLEGISSMLDRIRQEGKPSGVREIPFGGRTYEQRVSASPARSLVRIYMTDVTERKQAEEARQRYWERLKTLQVIDRAILGTSSPQAVGDAALHHMEQAMPFLRASITTFDLAAGEGTVVAIYPQSSTSRAVGSRIPLSAFGNLDELRKGTVWTFDDSESSPQEPLVDPTGGERLCCSIVVPLISQEELIGVLNLGSDRPGAFSLEVVGIAREVADSLAIALHQADLHAQVGRHAAELEDRVVQRTQELESFSYSVSHDLRAPLRAIGAFSHLLARDYADKLDAEGHRRLDIIRSGAQNMELLIDDLLAFSRSVRQQMQVADIDLRDLAGSVFEKLRLLDADRHVQFTIGELPAARGDRNLIRQVFDNLLANAMKFTRLKDPAVIEVGHRMDAGEVVYYVKDNGVGFDDRYADKLFGVFQRLHSSDEFEGSGVGLAIVQRIIKRHGGRVWAEGRVNEGTTVYFTLPRIP